MKINKYSGNIIISILPGALSILLSFFSIPIYLKYLGLEQYGNYLILHIALEKAREISLLPRPLPGMTTVPLSIHMSPSIP